MCGIFLLQPVTLLILHFTSPNVRTQMPSTMSHTSHVTCHLSPVTCHLSPSTDLHLCCCTAGLRDDARRLQRRQAVYDDMLTACPTNSAWWWNKESSRCLASMTQSGAKGTPSAKRERRFSGSWLHPVQWQGAQCTPTTHCTRRGTGMPSPTHLAPIGTT